MLSRIAIAVCLISRALPTSCAAADQCASTVRDVPIKERVIASAAIFANWREKPGSIRFESSAIFNAAKDQVASLKAPDYSCPPGCAPKSHPSVVFRSAPRRALVDYSDAVYCNQLEKITTRQPLRFSNTQLHSIDELNKWIGDLSRGKSVEGKALYEKCDASCSPRYEYLITLNDGESLVYTVTADIVCGAARHRADNQYNLDSFFRFGCEPE